MKYIKN